MDLSTVIRFYIEKMLKDVKGMKVLLLDSETTRIVSTVYSQSEILEQEVYLVEKLDADPGEQLLHLKVGLLEEQALSAFSFQWDLGGCLVCPDKVVECLLFCKSIFSTAWIYVIFGL